MKQIESIKLGMGGEIISAEIKTVKTVNAEQFCQIYLRDNEEFLNLQRQKLMYFQYCGIPLIITKIKIWHYQEIKYPQMNS